MFPAVHKIEGLMLLNMMRTLFLLTLSLIALSADASSSSLQQSLVTPIKIGIWRATSHHGKRNNVPSTASNGIIVRHQYDVRGGGAAVATNGNNPPMKLLRWVRCHLAMLH